jgi:Protein of unknown function (DUF2934)
MFTKTAEKPTESKRKFRLSGGRVTTEARGEELVRSMPTPAPSAAAASEVPPATDDKIRERAYQLWEAAGRPEGDGVRFWIEAEREASAV